MKVEIWSDIVCPFCYIGKRKFELALESFPLKDKVEIVWKSFQLDPSTTSQPGTSVIDYLASRKGISTEHSEKLHDDVTRAAAEVGLEYNFDRAVIANTIKAHQLIHFAAAHKLQNEAEEAIFKAYFTDGKDVGDIGSLIQIAADMGLNPEEAKAVLENDTYLNELASDIEEAQQLGVRGVPFFVFNRQYAVSGAQPVEVFADVLTKVSEQEITVAGSAQGASCDVDGNCN